MTASDFSFIAFQLNIIIIIIRAEKPKQARPIFEKHSYKSIITVSTHQTTDENAGDYP